MSSFAIQCVWPALSGLRDPALICICTGRHVSAFGPSFGRTGRGTYLGGRGYAEESNLQAASVQRGAARDRRGPSSRRPGYFWIPLRERTGPGPVRVLSVSVHAGGHRSPGLAWSHFAATPWGSAMPTRRCLPGLRSSATQQPSTALVRDAVPAGAGAQQGPNRLGAVPHARSAGRRPASVLPLIAVGASGAARRR